MSWFPIGPDFVRDPRVVDFQRLSRRNLQGEGGRSNCIAFEPGASGAEPETLYLVNSDQSGQCAAFRRRRAETAWVSISDVLRQADSNVDPQWVAVSPHDPARIYLATWNDKGVYISTNRGEAGSWGPKRSIPGRVRKLVIDPRPVTNIGKTVLYAATDGGLYRSGNDGKNWKLMLDGDIWSFCFLIGTDGSLHAYAGVYQSGVWYADTEPTKSTDWTNLNTSGIGLPAHVPVSGSTPENFHAILVDCCSANPSRAYAWFVAPTGTAYPTPAETVGLYTTGTPRTAWALANPLPSMDFNGGLTPLHPMQGFDTFVFAVAPNSPGDGLADILFFGNIGNARSINGGVTWKPVRQFFHPDMHGYAFYPEGYAAGSIPTFYLGCDGGLGANTRIADPGFAVETDLSTDQNNAGTSLFPNSSAFANLNDGLQNSLVYVLGGDPDGIAPPYLGCVDTGLAVRAGGLGWRSFGMGDTWELAVARGADGVKLWEKYLAGDRDLMRASTDNGGYDRSGVTTVELFGETSSYVMPTSNFILESGDQCLLGAFIEETITTTTAAIAPGTDVVVPVVSTAGISNFSYLAIGIPPNRQGATAQDVTPTTFRVSKILKAHPAGSAVRPLRDAVLRVDQAGVAHRISQHLGGAVAIDWVTAIAANRTASPNTLACVKLKGSLWRVDGALTASGPATWVEVSAGKPEGAEVASIAVSTTGDLLVMLLEAIPSATTAGAVTTPLFVIASGGAAWEAQSCVGLPTTTLADGSPQPFGRLVVDPVQPDTFYAIHGAQVYQVRRDTAAGAGVWVWTPVASGLPGCWVSDLWIGNLAAPGSAPKVVLRAGVIGRGVWEVDVTEDAPKPAVDLYVRRHALDHGWLTQLRDGLPDPYNPVHHVWHYQCADAKIEAPQPAPTGLTFFQTDPEASGVEFSGPSTPAGPITNVEFDQLRDDSQLVPEGTAVRLHVQVQNRSVAATSGVRVWVLYAPAAAGVPALDSTTSGTNFPFWSQFQPNGQIVPALPASSSWKAVGSPVVLDGVDVSHPRIASWRWPVPALAPGEPGHYCLALFVHSAAAPVGESTNVDLDSITLHNKQVGQKNLHIVELGSGAGSGAGASGTGTGSAATSWPNLYIEFHNPTLSPRTCSLAVDLRAVPEEVEVALRFTRLTTVHPLQDSISGIMRHEAPGLLWWLGWPLRALVWLLAALFPGSATLRRLPIFEPTRYVARGGRAVRVEDVVLPPRAFAAARLQLSTQGAITAGAEFCLEIQQLVQESVVGGSTFLFRGPKPAQAIVPHRSTPEEFAEEERIAEEDRFRSLPPWIRRLRAAALPPGKPP
jgi:hypothetical protein